MKNWLNFGGDLGLLREHSLFMAGGGWWTRGGGGGRKFRDLLSCGGQLFLAYFFFGGGAIFFNALFYKLFFRESDITCIITVVGAQQQYKGMFLKHGGGAKIFQQCHGGEAIFLPCIREGGGRFFFRLSILLNHHHLPRP